MHAPSRRRRDTDASGHMADHWDVDLPPLVERREQDRAADEARLDEVCSPRLLLAHGFADLRWPGGIQRCEQGAR